MKCFYNACPKHAKDENKCTNKANICTASKKETIQYKLESINRNIPKSKPGFRLYD